MVSGTRTHPWHKRLVRDERGGPEARPSIGISPSTTTRRTLMRRTLPAALAAFAATAALAVPPATAAGDDGRDIAEVAAPDAGQAQVVVALKAGQAYRVEALCCSYGGPGSGDGVRVLDP